MTLLRPALVLLTDQQWDCQDYAEDEWSDNCPQRLVHKAPVSQWNLPLSPKQLQHLQAHFGPVPHSAGGRPGTTATKQVTLRC